MMEGFILPCLAAVVLPGWVPIMDNAHSHKGKKAPEWEEKATLKTTRRQPKRTLCTTAQALVVSFSRPLAGLT